MTETAAASSTINHPVDTSSDAMQSTASIGSAEEGDGDLFLAEESAAVEVSQVQCIIASDAAEGFV